MIKIELFDNQLYKEKHEEYRVKQFESSKLIKSKERVQKHSEVFTPKWMVKKMLSTPEIQKKLSDFHSTFLEPSAGEGAFLTEVLHQKLNHVDKTSINKNWRANAMWALMSIYGIELLEDNVIKARHAMIEVLVNHYQSFYQKELSGRSDFFKSAMRVVDLNIVQGNTLTYKKISGEPIVFNEWRYITNIDVLRIPFMYQSLIEGDVDKELRMTSNNGQMSLFSNESIFVRHYKISKLMKIYKEEFE